MRETEPPGLLAGLRTGEWLDQQSFPPLNWTVPGLLPEGMSLLVGPPKAGKSWVLLGILLAAACGGHALGQVPVGNPRRSLYLALEDGDRRMQDRCRSLLLGKPIPPLYNYLTRLAGPGTLLPTLTAYLDEYEDTGIIAVDTLGKVMPDARAGETTYSRDYRVGSALKNVADSRPGMSLVCVHHDRKAVTEDFVESVSGTNGLAGAADTIIVLRRQRQSTEALLLVTGRDVMEAEYAIVLKDGMWQLDGRDLVQAAKRARERKEESDLGEDARKILIHLADHPEGSRASEFKELFGNNAPMTVKRLYDAGRIVKVERGLYVLPVDPALEQAWDEAS